MKIENEMTMYGKSYPLSIYSVKHNIISYYLLPLTKKFFLYLTTYIVRTSHNISKKARKNKNPRVKTKPRMGVPI